MKKLNSRQEKKQFYKMVLSLVVPMAAQNLINVAISSANVVMLGRVGEDVLAASALAGQVMFILSLVVFGVTSGAAVLTAQYWGKGDITTIEKILGFAMRVVIVIALAFMVAALTIPEPIMRLFTTEETVIREGVSFLQIAAFAYVFMGMTMVYLFVMRSVERVVVSTVVYGVSLFVNIGLNAVFIFGLLGFPAMGIKGAALAMVLARMAEFIIVIIYGKFINKEVCFRMKYFLSSDKLLMQDFLKYSIPVILNETTWGLGISTVTAIIGNLSSEMVAANSIAQVIKQLAAVAGFGLAGATAIIIGKVIGEGKEDFALEYSKRLTRLAIILGGLGAGVILLISPLVSKGMNMSAETTQYLEMMLAVMAFYVWAQSVNALLIIGVFRAGGDTKWGLILDAGTLWGFAVFLGAMAAFVWKLPPTLVYIFLLCDEFVELPMSFWRYRSKKWLKNVTR